MQKLPKCACPPSSDHNLLCDISDLDIHGDENFDTNAQDAADDEQMSFTWNNWRKNFLVAFGLLKKKLTSCMG